MVYVPHDKWAKRAREKGYAARAAYKLLDIDWRFHIFKKGDLVLDLGSAPGSWIQVALEKIGPKGFIIGVDLEPPKAGASVNFAFLRKDIYDTNLESELRKITKKPFDVILSDAAPNTTGQKDIDQWRAHELSLRVFDIIKSELKKGGCAVIKVFEGPNTSEFLKSVKLVFGRVNLIKPEASTKNSKEAYIIAINKITRSV